MSYLSIDAVGLKAYYEGELKVKKHVSGGKSKD
ncbi:hypothetical protein VSF3289_00155 [Vibrio scophthalmi]|uniref:Uncharacterized protein n=1 Tax=Vibrio scophthalmi TaxID=45658 RepID=A0A1E3WK87_9VIBR|nr:hypothetical protein VSF3289_00155 [Vibrio scophthalmi]